MGCVRSTHMHGNGYTSAPWRKYHLAAIHQCLKTQLLFHGNSFAAVYRSARRQHFNGKICYGDGFFFFFFSAAFRLRLVASRRQHRRRVLPVQLSLLKMEFSGMDAAGITKPILRQLTRVHATCPAQGSTKRADIQCQTHLHDELGIKSRFIGDTRPYPIAQHTRGPNSLGARRI